MWSLPICVSFLDIGPGRAQSFIRGVSTGGDVDTGKESTVGVYIDETPVTEGSSQPDLKLYDIDRVEVLRGPQGTLYGSGRSEEHTSELQSLMRISYAVFCLKKQNITSNIHESTSPVYNTVNPKSAHLSYHLHT